APALGEQEQHPGRGSQKPDQDDDESHGHHHHHGRKENRHPHKHEHKQEHGHGHGHRHPSPSEASHFSPHLEKTVGWVKVLPPKEEHVSLHTLPENQKEHIDGEPVPPEKAKPVPASPDTHGVGDVKKLQTDTSEGKPGLTKPATGPAILPFPEGPLQSDACPGEPKFVNSIILPLLPRNPVKI
ncbi:uncharacterized histidine-rich protein DDB_G0274557-like, partial [Terrapene carolina triunguis]|uniref:uncharacterized histidine-rich protein DDB_G0274557-like n=1 Tax=Terrapene triunguis TaxID=2587831 RepID=UPI000CEFEE32